MAKTFNDLIKNVTSNQYVTVAGVFAVVIIILIITMYSVFKGEKKQSK